MTPIHGRAEPLRRFSRACAALFVEPARDEPARPSGRPALRVVEPREIPVEFAYHGPPERPAPPGRLAPERLGVVVASLSADATGQLGWFAPALGRALAAMAERTEAVIATTHAAPAVRAVRPRDVNGAVLRIQPTAPVVAIGDSVVIVKLEDARTVAPLVEGAGPFVVVRDLEGRSWAPESPGAIVLVAGPSVSDAYLRLALDDHAARYPSARVVAARVGQGAGHQGDTPAIAVRTARDAMLDRLGRTGSRSHDAVLREIAAQALGVEVYR